MRTAKYDIPTGTLLTTADFFKAMLAEPRATVYSRIRSLVNSGNLKRVGRGQYARTDKSDFAWEVSPLMKSISDEIKAAFPYIDYCLWDLSPINQVAQHLININIIIVDVDRDAVEAVYRKLHETHDKVVTSGRMFDELSDYDGYILVRKLVTDTPMMTIDDVPMATLEKLLVDLASDKEFNVFQGSELHHIFENAISQFTINRNRILRYAGRKNQREQMEKLLNDNTSIL